MALPGAITPITVSGTYLKADGTPAAGTVTFVPSIAAATDGVIVPILPLTVTLDEDGAFSTILAATDDADWEASGFTYEVREKIQDAAPRSYSIEVPAASAGGALDLATVAPVAEPNTLTPYFSKLIVRAEGAADLASLPNGRNITGGAALSGAYLVGSATGGEDDGTGTDTTPHLNFYGYQRAQNGSFGESLRHWNMKADTKLSIAWWFPKSGYNDATEDPVTTTGWAPQAWVIAHSKANDGLSYHNHLSFEVMSPSNGLTTRLEIPFVDQETWTPGSAFAGVATTNIRTHDADFTVSADSGVLRVGGTAVNRDILLSNSSLRAAAGERWKIRADNTTEAGSNVGSDLSIRNYADNGSSIGIPLFLKRSTGNVVLGGSSASDTSAARLTAIWGTSGVHGFYAKPSATPGNGAAYAALMTLTTERFVDVRVTGDANARHIIYADGKFEWGDGTARDTNLYRSAANVLKTDDSLHVALDFRHLGTNLGFYNATAVAKPSITGSRGGNAALASLLTQLATLGLVTDSTTA
jgi:hypothetical protein